MAGFGRNREQSGFTVPFGNSPSEGGDCSLPERAILNKTYQVQRVLGRGNFGITYLCEDLNLGIKVAIKEYFPHGTAQRDSLTRYVSFWDGNSEKGKAAFLNEARTLAQLHAQSSNDAVLMHIVPVSSVFEEHNTVYMVMKYIPGNSLKKHVQRSNGLFSAEQAFRRMIPVAQAMAAVHKKGILHLDISPSNIMLDQNGELVLIDFGASRDQSALASDKVEIFGNRDFAPLEQLKCKGLSRQSDVYALCATIYFCIMGFSPTRADLRKLGNDIVWSSEQGKQIPPALKNVLETGLSLYPNDRFENFEAFIRAANWALAHPFGQQDMDSRFFNEETTRMSFGGGTSKMPGKTGQTQKTVKTGADKRKGRGWMVCLVLAIVVIGAATAAVTNPGVSDFVTSFLTSIAGQKVDVPDLSNMTVKEAKEAAQKAGLTVDDDYEFVKSGTVDRGHVVSQSPSSGASVSSGSKITITFSSGSTATKTFSTFTNGGDEISGPVTLENDYYVLPDSSTHPYSPDELKSLGLNEAETRIAAGELLARYNFHFTNNDLRLWFLTTPGYVDSGETDVRDKKMNDTEKDNLDLLLDSLEGSDWNNLDTKGVFGENSNATTATYTNNVGDKFTLDLSTNEWTWTCIPSTGKKYGGKVLTKAEVDEYDEETGYAFNSEGYGETTFVIYSEYVSAGLLDYQVLFCNAHKMIWLSVNEDGKLVLPYRPQQVFTRDTTSS